MYEVQNRRKNDFQIHKIINEVTASQLKQKPVAIRTVVAIQVQNYIIYFFL